MAKRTKRGLKAAFSEGAVRLYFRQGVRRSAWYMVYRDAGGTRHTVSTRTSEKARAREVARIQDRKLDDERLGLGGRTDRRAQIALLVPDYLRVIARHGTEKQVQDVRSIITRAVDHMHVTTIGQITVARMDAYLDHLAASKDAGGRDLAGRTVNKHAEVLKAFCKRFLRPSPLEDLERRPEHVKRRIRRVLTREQMARVLMIAKKFGEPWENLAYMLGYYAGLRKREVLNLTWGRVDLEHRTLRFRPQDQKSKKDSLMPIGEALHRELMIAHAAMISDGARTEASSSVRVVRGMPEVSARAMKKTMAACGIPWWEEVFDTGGRRTLVADFHCLRHTCLTHMGQAPQAKLHVLQDFARHSDPKITRGYLKEDMDAEREHVAALDNKDEGGRMKDEDGEGD